MTTPSPDEPPGEQEDHTHWQVVLSDPSSRKLVLYSPLLRRLAVQPTPPGSPRASGSRDPRRASFATAAQRRQRSVVRGEEGMEGRLSPLAGPDDDDEHSDGDGSDDNSTPPAVRALGARAGMVGPPPSVCPLCFQDLPRGPGSGSRSGSRRRRRAGDAGRAWLLPPPWGDELSDEGEGDGVPPDYESWDDRSAAVTRALPDGQSYFDLLSEVNSLASTPASTAPRALPPDHHDGRATGRLDEGQMNEGYFARFFEELQLLGKGGQGSVYLVRHVLNGEALGLYACKKIPVGDSTPSLLAILREVHLLESATHANITRYHHAWLETCTSRSAFAPPVPTLHILMEFANGASLQGFIDARKGSAAVAEEGGRERARRARREGRERAVHLLSVEDVLALFEDIVKGLAFLHGRNILHLDLKAENVLLHWDDEALLPTCKLSDFGNATSDSYHAERHGGSGTLLYTPPEAFFTSPLTGQLPPPDRATDMWALGLILHLLCFLALPYANAEGEDTQAMEDEVKRYGGFHPLAPLPPTASARQDLPPSLLALLAALIHRTPSRRPTCDKVLRALEGVRAELKRGWKPEGEGEVVVLAASRGRWVDGSRALDVSRWSSMRGRSSGRLEGPPLVGSADAGGGDVEGADETEGRAESDRRPRPPMQRPCTLVRRVSSPSLSRSRSSPLPLPSAGRAQLPLPPPSSSPSSALASTKEDAGSSWGGGAVAIWAGASRGGIHAAMLSRMPTVLAAIIKLLLLARASHSSLPLHAQPGTVFTVSAAPSIPLVVVALLLLETALDVALAQPRWTAGIMLIHVLAMRWT